MNELKKGKLGPYLMTAMAKGVDIEAEYNLIQQKKSRLSRSLRDRVVFIYEKRKAAENEEN